MRTKKRLGEMLIEEGLIKEDEVKKFLFQHKESDLKFGQFIIDKGIVTESQIVDLISKQLNIRKYSPQNYPLDFKVAHMISSDVAQRYQLVPVKQERGVLLIAMTDPLDITAMDRIEALTNCEVDPLICTEQELNHLIGTLYNNSSDIDDVLESIEDTEVGEHDMPHDSQLQISSLHDMAGEPPVIRLVNTIISQAVKEGASDIHISPEAKSVQIRFRVDGRLCEVPSPPKEMLLSIVSRIKILANMDISNFRTPQDGRINVRIKNRHINIRVSTIPTIHGENVVMRLLDRSTGVLKMDQLGMSPDDMEMIERVIKKPYGMILSTGPTGSGKTSTLFSILNKINTTDINVMTLEDPVEYQVDKIRQVQLNKKAGMTFASGLRSILRQDPDVILVGEIRDSETAGIAVQAALTGHKLLCTLHTNDSVGAVTRLLDMNIEPFLISSVMLISIAQRLVRTICPFCRESYKPDEIILQAIGLDMYPVKEFQRGRGCRQCMNLGYKGRTGIFELFVIDEHAEGMIIKGINGHDIKRELQKQGKLKTLREDAAKKISMGITTVEEVASAIMN